MSTSQLERKSDEELKATCLNVYNVAVQLVDVLADFGQMVDDVTQLKKEIDGFSVLISSPCLAIVTRSQATKELDNLMCEANDLLRNKIDTIAKNKLA